MGLGARVLWWTAWLSHLNFIGSPRHGTIRLRRPAFSGLPRPHPARVAGVAIIQDMFKASLVGEPFNCEVVA
jgi:hypothetical protein